MRLCRYEGRVLVRTLYVNDICLISIGYVLGNNPLQHIDLHLYKFSPPHSTHMLQESRRRRATSETVSK